MLLNIDTLLEYLPTMKKQEIDILNEPFIDMNFEDYLIENFNDLKDSVPETTWEEVIMKANTLFMQLDSIHKEYGKLIIDFYLARVQDIYNIPEDKIKFSIMDDREEECESCQKIDMDDVEEEGDFNEALRDEINHLHLRNALVNGGALLKWDELFADIKEDIDSLDPKIYPVIRDFCKYAQFMTYAQIPIKGMEEVTVGEEQLDFSDEEKTTVKVKGMNFVIVAHEILKGVYDIYSEHAFPRHLEPYAQKYVRKVTSDLFYEKWAWLYARKMFQINIDKKYDGEEPYYKYLFHVFKKPYQELLQFLMET